MKNSLSVEEVAEEILQSILATPKKQSYRIWQHCRLKEKPIRFQEATTTKFFTEKTGRNDFQDEGFVIKLIS